MQKRTSLQHATSISDSSTAVRTCFVLIAVFAVDGAAPNRSTSAADKPNPHVRQVKLRFVGEDKQVPLQGIQVVVTEGHGRDQKKLGPYKTDKAGAIDISLPQGFYSLHLQSKKELPYLPVEALWSKRARSIRPDLSLAITDSGAEKWLNGQRQNEGVEAPAKPAGAPRVTYTLLKACELVLRAVDVETGKGLAGAKFYTENALAEEWAHSIHGENLGAKSLAESRPVDPQTIATDMDGNFRRLVGANAGFKYGVESAPPGYDHVDPGLEVDLEILYGQRRAEHVFKFRRLP